MKVTKEDISRARETLAHLRPGDTVYTILRHVSRSGMQRQVGVVLFRNGQAYHPNFAVAALTGYRLNRSGARDALIVNGCGFNAGHAIVTDLAHRLGMEWDALRHEEL